MYEVELHYAPTPERAAHVVVVQIEASCHTELANKAYQLQTLGGYRVVRNPLTGKIRVVGLQVEYVSFGPVVRRNENGSVDYGSKKQRSS